MTIVFGLLTADNPGDEEEIGSNTDNTVSHQCGSKLFELYDQSKDEQNWEIDDWVPHCVRWDQSLPLQYYQLVIQDIYEQEIAQDAKFIENLQLFITVEMF